MRSDSLRLCEAHSPKAGIFQQGLENWRIESNGQKQGIDLTVVQCIFRVLR
jgi:hypothetical protein